MEHHALHLKFVILLLIINDLGDKPTLTYCCDSLWMAPCFQCNSLFLLLYLLLLIEETVAYFIPIYLVLRQRLRSDLKGGHGLTELTSPGPTEAACLYFPREFWIRVSETQETTSPE